MQKCPWALELTCRLHSLIAAEAFRNKSSLAFPLETVMVDTVSLFARAKPDTCFSVTDAVMTCTYSLKGPYTSPHCKQAQCIQEHERKLQIDICIVQLHVTFS